MKYPVVMNTCNREPCVFLGIGDMVLFPFSNFSFFFFPPLFVEDWIRLLSDLAVLIWSSTWATALTGSWLRCSGGFTLRSLRPRRRGSPSRRLQHTQTSAPLRYKDTLCSTRQTRLAPSKTLQRSSSEYLQRRYRLLNDADWATGEW